MTTAQTSGSGEAKRPRDFDLVLFGATGFTGQLVAGSLAQKRPAALRWALAGRSHDKLARVRSELASRDPRLAELPLLVADSADAEALRQLASRTRVVATTVGPFIKYGQPLLAACAAAGTHYCDITGETQFIRWAIDEHDAAARASGARIVPTCGFDSIPSDLGVLLLHEHLQQHGARLTAATFSLEKMRGQFSGGTVASMMAMVEQMERQPALRQLLADPYALVPERHGDRAQAARNRDQLGVRWDDELQRWTAPFMMAAINTRVVHRTNALLGYPYGRDFRYREVMSFPSGPKGLLRAAGLTAGMGGLLGLVGLRPTRALLQKLLPAPGEGPSEAQRTAGYATIRILGTSAREDGGTGATAQAELHFPGDPGYSETAKLLAESALCLSEDELPPRAGLLTPAAAMGDKLIDRLRARAQSWSVRSGG